MSAESVDAIMSIHDLVMNYGDFRAIDRINLTIRRGSIHTIIGPNGAGKTTLFHCLTGERRASAGHIVLDGEDITHRRPDTRVGIGLTRSFQITSLFKSLSVRENLRLAAQGRNGVRALAFWHSQYSNLKNLRVADDLLVRLELTGCADTIVGYLSHGQQRLLEVGMALAGEPRLLLLDEPTSGMGVDDIPTMTRLIQELGRDRTVMLIEHNMSIVMAISETVTVMHQGRILAEGPPDVVRQNDKVRSAYLGSTA